MLGSAARMVNALKAGTRLMDPKIGAGSRRGVLAESPDRLGALRPRGLDCHRLLLHGPNIMIFQPRSAYSLFLAAVLLLGFTAPLTGAPANDDFANAQQLTGSSGVLTVSLSGATLEPDETVWQGLRRSVWYRWTAPGAGTLLFTIARSATPSAVAFLLQQDSDGRTDILTTTASEEPQQFPVDAGRTYWLSVMDRFGTSDEATLSFQWLAPPPNDAVGLAIPLPVDGTAVSGSAVGASLDDVERRAGYGPLVWYRWTAPVSGRAFPELEVPEVLPPLAFRDGMPSRSTYIWNLQNGVPVQAGESLHIGVSSQHHAFRLRVRLETARLVVTPDGPFESGTPWTALAETTPWDGDLREVEFQINEGDRIVDATPPYVLDSPGLPAGAHTIRASLIRRNGSIRPIPPLSLSVRPVNDRFEAAAELIGEQFESRTDLSFATAEPGEPAHGALPAQRTAWWKWTAPRSGGVELIADFTSGSTFAVYTGDRLDALKPVRAGDSALLRFAAEAGVTYRMVINVREWTGNPGAVSLRLRMAAPVPNDLFADALPIAGSSVVLRASTEAATSEPGERTSVFGDRTVWWRWTAPADGYLTVEKTPDSRWVDADVYEGESLATLVRQTGSWDDSRNVPVRSGVTYRIQARAGEANEVELTFRFVPAASNDDFGTALELRGLPVTASGDLENATLESGEPTNPFNPSWRSLWYRWTASASGWVSIASVEASAADPRIPGSGIQITVFRGTRLPALEAVALQESPQAAGFETTAGVTYFIQVRDSRYELRPRPFEFVLDGVPDNDDLAAAGVIAPAGGRVSGSMVLSTPDAESPAPSTDGDWGSLWYRWVPATSGWATVTVTSADTVRALFFSGGPGIQDLQPVPVSPAIRIHATALHRVPIVAGQPLIVGLFEVGWSGRVQSGSPFELGLWPSSVTLVPSAETIARTEGDSLPVEVAGEAVEEASVVLLQDGRAVLTSPALTQPAFLHTFSNVASGAFTVVGVARLSEDRVVSTAPLKVRVAPVQDAIQDAVPIVSLPLRAVGDLAGASFESGEASPPSEPSYGSLWWRWKPDRTGLVQYSGTVELEVFRGDALSNLVRVASAGSTTPGVFTLESGVEYRLRVTRSATPTPAGSVPFEFTLAWLPPNDAFSAATRVAGSMVNLIADLAGATTETGEVGAGAYFAQRTAWFRWTSPGDGWLWMDCNTPGDGFAASVSSGDRLDQLVRLTSGLAEWGPVRTPVRGGSDLVISLDALSSGLPQAVEWTIRWFANPTNDSFAQAQRVEGMNPEFFGINFGATREPGEPERRTWPASRPIDRTVWFRWTAPATGWVRLENQDPSTPVHFERLPVFFEPFVGDSLETLVSLWPEGERLEPTRRLEFQVEAGRTYSFLVGDESPLDHPFHLVMRGPAPPANDAFLQAETLAPDALELNGTLWNATREPGELLDELNPNLGSVWFRWTSPARGRLGLYDSMLQFRLWQGQSWATLQPVETPWQSGVFRTEAGRTYWIQVMGNPTLDFSMPIAFGVSPANDDFANARELPATGGRVEGPVAFSTFEPGEDRVGVWFRWTAPGPGQITVRSDSEAWMNVFRGPDPLNLTLQVPVLGARSRYEVLEGETYYIHVSEGGGPRVDFTVEFTPTSVPDVIGASWSGDRFRLPLPAAPGAWVELETSPDLREWTPAGSFWLIPTEAESALEFSGPASAGFFRFTPR